MFKRERLLIKLSAILGAIGIIMVAALYLSVDILKNTPEIREFLEESEQRIDKSYLTTKYYVLTILSILDVIALFIIERKLNESNYKTMGVILLVLAILSYWLLWFVPIILAGIAGVLLLTKPNTSIINNDKIS